MKIVHVVGARPNFMLVLSLVTSALLSAGLSLSKGCRSESRPSPRSPQMEGGKGEDGRGKGEERKRSVFLCVNLCPQEKFVQLVLSPVACTELVEVKGSWQRMLMQ